MQHLQWKHMSEQRVDIQALRAASFITAPTWKSPTCPQWMDFLKSSVSINGILVSHEKEGRVYTRCNVGEP